VLDHGHKSEPGGYRLFHTGILLKES